MRKVLFVLAMAMFLSLGASVAQEAPEPYVVQPGDTLWELSGEYLDDPLKWGELIGKNPFLKEPGRQFQKEDGTIVVVIKPGEQLNGLQEMGITAIPLPELLDKLRLAPAEVETAESQTLSRNSLFWGIVAALVTALLIYAMTRYSWRFKNPITSGQPIVEGGIPPSDSGSIESRFEQMAQRRFGELYPTADSNISRPRRVSDIEHGSLSGNGQVHYRDSVETRHLVDEPGYRAEFEFVNPDGSTRRETLYFLQRCANDVTFQGKWLTGYTFTLASESERVVVPAPAAEEPEPTPVESPAPEPIPHPAVRLVSESADTKTTLKIGDQTLEFATDCVIEITDKEVVVKLAEGGKFIADLPRRRRAAKPKPAVAQAASGE